jgi:NifU-like protein involved in Fe-S cluster formation
MKRLMIACAIAALAGCGVDTASTAATGAAIKAKEAEEAKKTQDRTRQKIDQTMDKMHERAQQAGGDSAQR